LFNIGFEAKREWKTTNDWPGGNDMDKYSK